MAPGQHDASEVEQLSREVIDLPLSSDPSKEPSNVFDLSSSILTPSPTNHFSPPSSCSYASLSGIPSRYSSVSSSVSPSSLSPTFTSFPCSTTFQSSSLSPHYVGMTGGKTSSHYLPTALKPSLLVSMDFSD